MTCTDVRDRLDALLDGTLSLPDWREADAHLADCGTCRRAYEAARALRHDAKALPTTITPPDDLWPAISARIDAVAVRSLPRSPSGARWRRWALGAAAAVALVAGSSAVTLWLADGEPATAARQTTAGPVLAIEADYAEAAADLERLLAERRASLSTETIDVLERNFRVINDAIAEARAALERDPANRTLRDRLLGVHAMKLDLLQRAVKL